MSMDVWGFTGTKSVTVAQSFGLAACTRAAFTCVRMAASVVSGLM